MRRQAQGGKEGTPPLDYLNNYLHKNTKHLNRTGSNSVGLARPLTCQQARCGFKGYRLMPPTRRKSEETRFASEVKGPQIIQLNRLRAFR